ncbi:MAG: hypothetical protein AAAFM81_08505 [Pseudomonadota bacterium]
MNTSYRKRLATMIVLGILIGCSQPTAETVSNETTTEASESSAVTLGDGAQNWIKMDALTRDGSILTIPEVLIANNGWLVIHRFKDGKPYGKDYLAASYVSAGTNLDVQIELPEEPAIGTPMLIMLHSDVNENRQFDFVFVDDTHVLDKAVFEGNTMVARIFKTP